MKSAFKKIKKNTFSLDFGLLFTVTLCSTLSTLLLYSIHANNVISTVGNSYWQTQLGCMAVGIGVAVLIAKIDYKKMAKLWFIYAPAAIFLVLLTFTSLGVQREGADDRAWLDLRIVTFQPSELLKLAFILTFSLHLSRDEENMNRPLHMLLLCLHGIVPIGIVGLQGDYGTALVFASIFLFMILSSNISWKYVTALPFLVSGAAAFMWFFMFQTDHKNRILVLFNPGSDPEGLEWQQNLGLRALQSGGILGKGLFAGEGKYVSLPEMHNDFMFTYVGQVFGFVGSVAVIIFMAYICLKIFADSRFARDRMGRFIGMGAFGLMLSHCIMNIGMVLKVMPVIGVPLPFISAGGTAMISMYAIIGLVLSVYNHRAKTYNVFYDDKNE